MILSPIRRVIFFLLLDIACSGRLFWRFKDRVHRLREQRGKQHFLMRALSKSGHVARPKEGFIHQPLDHFDGENTETFSQKFYVNDFYWDRPEGPVFLYIGGEGPMSETSVLAGHHVEMAEEFGALLVALEHRFYGDSINPDGLEVENLVYLSSQQALADLTTFHRHISQQYDLSHKNTWISFGGSYAGALSAWLRGKFPHLIFGAVASSAPVRAKLDFSSYNKMVGLSLMDESVGGSNKCAGNVWEAFAAVEAALFAGNTTEVGKDFDCCETPDSDDDQIELMQSLADVVIGIVQYNEEGGPLSISQLCDIMTNKSESYDEELEAYDRLIKVVEIYQDSEDTPCLDASHEQTIEELSNTTVTKTGSSRQWYYQTCTEFGFYQTCEDASCPFSRMLTLQSQTELCPQVFDIPTHTLPERIAFTNHYYGGNRPETHHVLYVNGKIDPWQELSVLHNGTAMDRDRALLIPDTAHCADMNPAKAEDRPTLQHAREHIKRHVAIWLKEAAWNHMI
ncbi:thymus-specific serine protease [Chanos chanos]|uniref:Thymus-specific serine protease n=1 Tax=Chanos chanos TaxID=29144 RepID=A0A6J2VRN5_CHACN|nr:thymus-specific serine protease-like [Chanos chanos]